MKRNHFVMASVVVCVELSTLITIESLVMHIALTVLLFGKDVVEVWLEEEAALKPLV